MKLRREKSCSPTTRPTASPITTESTNAIAELVERDPERARHAARADHAAQPHHDPRGRRQEQRIDEPARRDLPDRRAGRRSRRGAPRRRSSWRGARRRHRDRRPHASSRETDDIEDRPRSRPRRRCRRTCAPSPCPSARWTMRWPSPSSEASVSLPMMDEERDREAHPHAGQHHREGGRQQHEPKELQIRRPHRARRRDQGAIDIRRNPRWC